MAITNDSGVVRSGRKRYSSARGSISHNSTPLRYQPLVDGNVEKSGTPGSTKAKMKTPYQRPTMQSRRDRKQNKDDGVGGFFGVITNLWKSIFGKREDEQPPQRVDEYAELTEEYDFERGIKRGYEQVEEPLFQFKVPSSTVLTTTTATARTMRPTLMRNRQVKSPFRTSPERMLKPESEIIIDEPVKKKSRHEAEDVLQSRTASEIFAKKYLNELLPAIKIEKSVQSEPVKIMCDASTETEHVPLLVSEKKVNKKSYGLDDVVDDDAVLPEPGIVTVVEEKKVSPQVDFSLAKSVKSASTSPIKVFEKDDAKSQPQTNLFTFQSPKKDDSNQQPPNPPLASTDGFKFNLNTTTNTTSATTTTTTTNNNNNNNIKDDGMSISPEKKVESQISNNGFNYNIDKPTTTLHANTTETKSTPVGFSFSTALSPESKPMSATSNGSTFNDIKPVSANTGFNFGATTSAETNSLASTNLGFKPEAKSSSTTSSGFNFSSSSASELKSPANTSASFNFSSTTTDIKPSNPSSTGFSFGATPAETKPSTSTSSGFSFNSTSSDVKPSTGFSFGASAATSDSKSINGAGFGNKSANYSNSAANGGFASVSAVEDKTSSGFNLTTPNTSAGFGSNNSSSGLSSVQSGFNPSTNTVASVAVPGFTPAQNAPTLTFNPPPTTNSAGFNSTANTPSFNQPSTNNSGFSFGSNAPAQNGFNFGSNSNSSNNVNNNSFAFGSAANNNNDLKPSGFSFGSNASNSSINTQFAPQTNQSFAFGSPQPAPMSIPSTPTTNNTDTSFAIGPGPGRRPIAQPRSRRRR